MPLRPGAELPSLDAATEWINGELGSADLLGQVSLVYFWAISCYICKNNLPKLQQWRDRYGDDLQMVGVHMPRQESDTDVDAVKAAIKELSIPDPVAIDNTHGVGEAFDNSFWPAYFLFDEEGKLKSRTAGDVGLDSMEKKLDELMQETAAQA